MQLTLLPSGQPFGSLLTSAEAVETAIAMTTAGTAAPIVMAPSPATSLRLMRIYFSPFGRIGASNAPYTD